MAVMMILVGTASAFINNTAVVAVLLPVFLKISRESEISPSKLLIPFSFASMFGGVCTLLGTSTNILVSSIAHRYGYEPFGMFEFSALGIVLFAAGILYMLAIGIRLVPERRGKGNVAEDYGMGDYIAEIVLLPSAKSVGQSMQDSRLVGETGIEIIEVIRKGRRLRLPPSKLVLQKGDVLRVVGDVQQISRLQDREGIKLKPEAGKRKQSLSSEEFDLVEAVIAANSELEGKTLKQLQFRDAYGATAVALRHRNEVRHSNLSNTKLRSGDVLLLIVRSDKIEALRERESFVVVSEVGLPAVRKSRTLIAAGIMAGVVFVASLGIVPIVTAAIFGCVAMVLSGSVTLDEAYKAIEWKVIFLLAGVLTLGIALERTGAANLLAENIISVAGPFGPIAVISGLYLLTTVLTDVMSNNATAALLTPIAITTANAFDVDPRPFLFSVAFAASLSFMTPVGYQTNTMIYAVGQYRFFDFTRVGAPLTILFWIIVTFLIPVIWPLSPGL